MLSRDVSVTCTASVVGICVYVHRVVVGDGRQVQVDGRRRRVPPLAAAGALVREREVEPRPLPADPAGLAVVRPGGLLGGAEGAEPRAPPLARVPDLRRPPPRPAVADAPVLLHARSRARANGAP
jgi:hypothetical protein